MPIIGVIGGTGVYDPSMFENIIDETIETPYGKVDYTRGTYKGKEVVFLARHGRGHSIPPHKINYLANIWGLKKLGVTFIISTTAVGSLNPDFQLGHFVLTDQFIDFTKHREHTFYDGGTYGVGHVDVTEPYDPYTRSLIEKACNEVGVPVHNGGTYVCTEGPRFETPAEIKMFRILGGHTVGMTNVPEVMLANEAEIAYATISMITNMAAGITGDIITGTEVTVIMKEIEGNLQKVICKTIEALDPTTDVPTHHKMQDYGGFKV